MSLQVDLTPPDKTSFKLTSVIPDFSKEQTITISGRAEPASKVIVGGTPYLVESDGTFSGDVSLSNGENILNFLLSDEAGNVVELESHTIVVDNVPPKVSTTFCGSKTFSSDDFNALTAGQEYVCISTGEWEDWRDPAPIPIVGYVSGEIGSITVDGKRVYPDENDEIYQRVSLAVPKGLNKYKVVVTDKYGNQTSTSLTMTVQSVNNNSYDDVMDRLDDIESQI